MRVRNAPLDHLSARHWQLHLFECAHISLIVHSQPPADSVDAERDAKICLLSFFVFLSFSYPFAILFSYFFFFWILVFCDPILFISVCCLFSILLRSLHFWLKPRFPTTPCHASCVTEATSLTLWSDAERCSVKRQWYTVYPVLGWVFGWLWLCTLTWPNQGWGGGWKFHFPIC